MGELRSVVEYEILPAIDDITDSADEPEAG
jgi:hypothetical protein